MLLKNLFKRTFCFMMSLSMAIPPQAYAVDADVRNQQTNYGTQTALGAGQYQSKPNYGKEALGAISAIGQTVRGTMAQMQAMNAYTQNMARLNTLYPKPLTPDQMPRLFLPPFTMPACQVLPAKTVELGPGSKCDGDFDPSKVAEYAALKDISFQISNTYDNFATKGNAKGGGQTASHGQAYTGQGLGCYERAQNNLEAQLRARLQSLDELKNMVDKGITLFEKRAEQDLKDIRVGNALLTGKPANLLEGHRFEDNFKDQSCRSFLTAANLSDSGKKGGYEAITDLLTQKVSTPSQNGGMAPSEMLSRAGDIEKDIEKVAEQIANQMSRKNLAEIESLDGLNLSSRSDIHKSEALANVVNEQIAKKRDEIEIMKKEFSSFGADPRAQLIFDGVFADNLNIDNAIAEYEKDHKNGCFNNYLKNNFDGPGGFRGRLQDPNISRKANNEADSMFKNYIENILNNNDFTIEQKIAQIKKIESEGRNSRYTMTTGRSIEINGRTVGASARLKASDIVGIFVQNCVERYNSEPGPQGNSPRAVINKLRDIQTKYKTYSNTFVSDVAGKIKSEMLRCPSDTSTGKAANSCSPNTMNPSNSKFCLKTAKVCASNMNACLNKAKTVLDNTRKQQKEIATRYKKNVDDFKIKMIGQFQLVNQTMTKQARMLDGLHEGFGSLFEAPVELNMSMLTDPKAMITEGIDPALQIEDPRFYAQKMKENLDKLRAQVEKQNNEIMNGPGGNGGGIKGEIAGYIQSYGNMKNHWDQISQNCMGMLQQYNQMMAEQQRAEAEQIAKQNEELASICNPVNAYNQNPIAACDKSGELADDILKATSVMGAEGAVAQLRENERRCNSLSGESDQNMFVRTPGEAHKPAAPTISNKDFCESDPVARGTQQCVRYLKILSDFEMENGTKECDKDEDDYIKEIAKANAPYDDAIKAAALLADVKRAPAEIERDEESKQEIKNAHDKVESIVSSLNGKKVLCKTSADGDYKYTLFDSCHSSDDSNAGRLASIVKSSSIKADMDVNVKAEFIQSYLQGQSKSKKCYFQSSLANDEKLADASLEVNVLQSQKTAAKQVEDLGQIVIPSCHGISDSSIGRVISGFGQELQQSLGQMNGMNGMNGTMGVGY